MASRLAFAFAAALTCALPFGALLLTVDGPRNVSSVAAEESYLSEAVSKQAQIIDAWQAEHASALRTLAHIPNLELLATEQPELGREQLRAFAHALPSVRAVILAYNSGQQYLRSDGVLIEVGDRPYHQEALAKGFGTQIAVSRTTSRPSYFMAVTLAPESHADPSRGGVATFALDLEQISATVVSSGLGSIDLGVQSFIAAPDGKLLAHSVPGAVVTPKTGELVDINSHPLWANKPLVGQTFLLHYPSLNGTPWVGAIRQTDLGWFTAVEMPEATFSAPLRTRLNLDIIALTLATLASAGLGATLAGFALARGPLVSALALAVASALPAASFVAHSWTIAESQARTTAGNLLAMSARSSARKAAGWLSTNFASAQIFTATPELSTRALSSLPQDLDWTHARLKLAISYLPWVSYANLNGRDGTIFYRTDPAKYSNISDRTYFKQARVESFGYQLVISRSSGVPNLLISRSIRDASGTFFGNVNYAVQPQALVEQFSSDPLGKNGLRMLTDKEGNLWAHPDKSQLKFDGEKPPSFTTHPLWAIRKSDDTVALGSFSLGDSHYMGAIARGGNLYSFAVLPLDEILEDALSERRSALLILGLVAAFAAFTGFFMSRRASP